MVLPYSREKHSNIHLRAQIRIWYRELTSVGYQYSQVSTYMIPVVLITSIWYRYKNSLSILSTAENVFQSRLQVVDSEVYKLQSTDYYEAEHYDNYLLGIIAN